MTVSSLSRGIGGRQRAVAYFLTVIAASSMALVPAEGQTRRGQPVTPSPTAQVELPSSPNALTVRQYYERRLYPAIWFSSRNGGEASRQLVSILRRAAVDGMPEGPDVAARVEVAVQRAHASNDPMATKAAELVLSTAWVDYVQATQRPSSNVIYGDPAIANSLPLPGQTLRVAEAAPSLARHLLKVSAINPIYAKLREVAIADASANGGRVSDKIMLNLERSRLLPGTGKYVFVNTAEQQLHMVENGEEVGAMKVVVGSKLKYGLPTPIVTSTMSYAVANPYWHVPPHLIRKFALEIAKRPDAYLKTHDYEVISDFGRHPTILPPSTVDWKAVAAGTQSVNLRQRPGGNNSMGKMKFPFPNREGIYLHDTPNREYFNSAKWPDRAQSNGCIRVEDYRRLANWLFGRDVAASGNRPEQILALPQRIQVYVTYLTMVPGSSELKSFEDRYGWDRPGVVAGGMDTTVGTPITSGGGQR